MTPLTRQEMVELFRDLAIILFSMFGILAMLTAAILGLLLYRKVAPTLDSAKWTAKRTREATSQLSKKVVKPLLGASTFAYSAGRIVAFIIGLSQGKGERKNGK